MNCPHCQAELTPHDASFGAKVGALHCYECGCCFLADGQTPRPGVPLCERSLQAVPDEESIQEPHDGDTGKKRALSDLGVDELRELAKLHNVDIPEGAKKPDIFKLLKERNITPVPPSAPAAAAPTGHKVVGDAVDHVAEGHLDRAWLESLDEPTLRAVASDWQLGLADDAPVADVIEAVAKEPVYFDPNGQ